MNWWEEQDNNTDMQQDTGNRSQVVEWKHRMDLFVIYRHLLEQSPFTELKRLLDVLSDDGAPYDLGVHAYGSFVRALYEDGGDLSACVREAILEGDDLFTRRILAGDPLTPEMEAQLDAELDVLEQIASLEAGSFASIFDGIAPLPAWRAEGLDAREVRRELEDGLSTRGCGVFAKGTMLHIEDGHLVPVRDPEFQTLDQLYGYRRERELVLKNTEALAEGYPASNVLLYGDAGTGKSTTVKACAAAFADKGVRLIEFKKDQVSLIPAIAEELSCWPLKFIFYIDDLTFTENDKEFFALKGILEGNIRRRSGNIVIYATSNRRHLVKETMTDRDGGDLHLNDTLQETMSLSSRFGLTVTFQKPEKDLYLEIVENMANEMGLEYEQEDLFRRAEAFAIRSNGRSPRTAKQFITQALIGLR